VKRKTQGIADEKRFDEYKEVIVCIRQQIGRLHEMGLEEKELVRFARAFYRDLFGAKSTGITPVPRWINEMLEPYLSSRVLWAPSRLRAREERLRARESAASRPARLRVAKGRSPKNER
jgi:hypothetical protein